MKSLKKYVVSNSLTEATWENLELIKGDYVEAIKKLKAQPGKDIAIFGSSDLAVTLIPPKLIDEFQIFINPLVPGKGKRLFKGIKEPLKLKLLRAAPMSSGNVILYYAPA